MVDRGNSSANEWEETTKKTNLDQYQLLNSRIKFEEELKEGD